MRHARLTMEGHHFVHVITRIVGREFLLHDREREYLWQLIEGQSQFSGVQVVGSAWGQTHCRKDNIKYQEFRKFNQT